MKVIRFILGKLILLYERLFSPKGIKRSEAEQAKIAQETAKFSLYQFEACPFCVKVRFAMKRLSLPIETRDAKNNEQYKQELIEQGGRHKVPCLKIESDSAATQWMYESNTIINYLEETFA